MTYMLNGGSHTMKRLSGMIASLALMAVAVAADEKVHATLFRSPGCGCCEGYASYLRNNGFDVTVVDQSNMTLIKKKYDVPENFEGCHTTVICDYVVEGHVPVGPIKRLLAEQPAIRGISLPGMPQGSPGMSGVKTAPFEVLTIPGNDGPASV